jgi:predicted CoA-substrate-specific enzyme activase
MADAVSLGIDLGSTTTKLVAIAPSGAILLERVEPTAPAMAQQAAAMVAEARARLDAASAPLVATGYGRHLVEGASRQVTEITCHARGVFHTAGRPLTLIDIGGQDTKVISVGPAGRVLSFAMNDKCAAGTGRFLEVAAQRLQQSLDEFGPTALSAQAEEPLSSTCVVFAESEMISLLARGVALAPIVRGLHRSLVRRVAALARGAGVREPVLLSGGVARNPAVRALLAEELGLEVAVPPRPQLAGALGAALLAQ